MKWKMWRDGTSFWFTGQQPFVYLWDQKSIYAYTARWVWMHKFTLDGELHEFTEVV